MEDQTIAARDGGAAELGGDMSREMQALVLMLNAIRLQLFAAQMDEVSKELRECLEQSARLADMAMELADLKETASASTGKATGG